MNLNFSSGYDHTFTRGRIIPEKKLKRKRKHEKVGETIRKISKNDPDTDGPSDDDILLKNAHESNGKITVF